MHILLILGIFLILLVLIMSLVNLKFNLFKHKNKKTETSDIDLKKLTHPRPKKFVKIKSTTYRPGMFDQQTIVSNKSLHSNILSNIDKLNKCLEKSYSILNYEKLVIQESKDGSKKFIVDLFIHDNNNNDTKRLLFEIIKDKDEFYLETIQYLNNDIERTPIQIESDDIYGINTNSIIDSVSHNPNKVIGISTSSLEKSILNKDNIKIKQNEIPQNINIFPSNKIKNKWNRNGLHETEKNDNSEGYNHACRQRLPTPNFNPTLATLPRSGEDKNEIFDMNRGIIGMPFANTRGHRVSASTCCS